MIYPISSRLKRVFNCSAGKPKDEVSLCTLRERVVNEFDKNQDCLVALMKENEKSLRYGQLIFYLMKTVQNDSAVRDMMTLGHLAKVISRVNLLKSKDDYVVLGLPNPLFDECSQQDRVEHFRRQTSLPMKGNLIENPIAERARAIERGILARFGIGFRL